MLYRSYLGKQKNYNELFERIWSDGKIRNKKMIIIVNSRLNLICINFNLQCPQLVCHDAKWTWHLSKVIIIVIINYNYLLEVRKLIIIMFLFYKVKLFHIYIGGNLKIKS